MDFLERIESNAIDEGKIAQIYRDSSMSFRELKEKSDALASYLIHKYGHDQSPVVIYGHKDHEMLISFLACFKRVILIYQLM